MIYVTQIQYDAYYQNIVKRWPVYQGLPYQGYEIVPDNDPRADSIGAWVGNDQNPRYMYIGIETDGYTHS